MPTSNDLQKRRSQLSSSKKALLEARLQGRLPQAHTEQIIHRRPAQATVPASFAQQRLWFLEQLEPGTATYHMPVAIRIHGHLDIAAFEQSLQEIMRRHEVLRTTFTQVDGTPFQTIHEAWNFPLEICDLRGSSTTQQAEIVSRSLQQQASQPFDLEAGPLLRSQLLLLGETTYLFSLTMHHIISDAWSTGIFYQELVTLYTATLAQEPTHLPTLPIQYADFACWQQQELQGQALERQLGYWKRQLEQLPDPLALPRDQIDHSHALTQTFRGSTYHFALSAELAAAIRRFCQQEQVTAFMVILAAFQGLLARYTGQNDILIGTSIANRTQPELEGLIGFFSNTLPLRTNLSGNPTIQELLSRVRQVALDAYANQDVPFERVLDRPLQLPVMFILQNAPQPSVALDNISFETVEQETHTAKFDLLFSLDDLPTMTGFFEYNADFFAAASIERLALHLQNYLTNMLADTTQKLADISYLSAAEQEQLLVQWNATAQPFPQEVTLPELFALQAEATPGAIALVDGEELFTYQEMNEQANRLAHLLSSYGVGPEVLVALYMERCSLQMITLLAILKAGGAYLPLDHTIPGARLLSTLDDARVSLVLTSSSLLNQLSSYTGTSLALDDLRSTLASYPATEPEQRLSPDHLAYVIYTSGSTGKPKGVQISHRAIINHCFAIRTHYQFSATDRVVQFASLSFDAAAEELYPTWSCGAALVLRPAELPTRIVDWQLWLAQHAVTVLDLPTAYWQHWVHLLPPGQPLPTDLRLVIVGGEQALPEPYARWRELAGNRVQWSNTYGPTETAVTALLSAPFPGPRPEDEHPALVPLGRPLANLAVYVLDRALHPVPVNVIGELYIAGAGLARGYLQRPALTADRFLPNPFAQQPGERMYRTGDLVRLLPDGVLQYCGRSDQQVKIRGYRIELGEISSVILQYPGVRECVVIAHEEAPGDKRLLAYLTAEPAFEQSLLRQFLQERLPAYMLPAAFLVLEALPMTTSGKVDTRALPLPDQLQQQSNRSIQAPANAVEEVLLLLWQGLLSREEISTVDNFFELGGHSLLSTQLMARVEQIFGVLPPLRLLFEQPTITHLATFLLQDESEREQRILTARLFLQVEQLSEDEIDALLQDTDNIEAEEQVYE